MRLKEPRRGAIVRVKDRPLEFSYWPMYRTTRRFGLQSSVFVTNPWTFLGEAIRELCPKGAQPEARSCLQQAEFFFNSGIDAELIPAKPLLLYYSFLNLGKAFALTTGVRPTFDNARHGLSPEGSSSGPGLDGYQLEAYRSPNSRGEANLFDDFLYACSGQRLPRSRVTYDATSLLAQIPVGHRVWCAPKQRRERFLSIKRISTMESFRPEQKIWLDLEFYADDLKRLGVTHTQLLTEANLAPDYTEVSNSMIGRPRKILRFQQNRPTEFTSRPSDEIPSLVEGLRHRLWVIVQSIPPYRKHYVYLCPETEQDQRLPQLAAPYALIFLLGSVTRYRPQEFDSLLNGRDGPFIQEFLASAPKQFLYLLASDFSKRDITLPAIV